MTPNHGPRTAFIDAAYHRAATGIGKGDQRLLEFAGLRQQLLEIHHRRFVAPKAPPELILRQALQVIDELNHDGQFRPAKT